MTGGFRKSWVPVGGSLVFILADGRQIEAHVMDVKRGEVALAVRAPQDVQILDGHTARDRIAPVSDPPRHSPRPSPLSIRSLPCPPPSTPSARPTPKTSAR